MKDRCTEATNVRLPSSLKDRAFRIATGNHLSMSDVVRLALIQMLPEMENGHFQLNAPHPK